MREAFKRLSCLKQGDIDNRKPKTYHLKKKLAENKKKNDHSH
jgi:hypothetical protein